MKGSRGTVTWTSGGPADVGAVHEQACQPCVDPDIGPRQHRGERLRADSFTCCTVVEAVRHGGRMHQQNPRQESQQRECHDVARGFRMFALLQLPIRVAIGDARLLALGTERWSRGRDSIPSPGYQRLRIGLSRRIMPRWRLRLVGRRIRRVIGIGNRDSAAECREPAAPSEKSAYPCRRRCKE